MYKKRSYRVISKAIPPSKPAQITIFMILGLLVLFIFIIIFSLSAGLKKEQLQEIQEKTLTKSFKKEALRIFVEDCLTDELEKGLVLIGKQGRLWSDQPGGTKHFEEGITGMTIGNERVFYGILRDPYLEYENAYPCSSESSPDEFCQYSFPNTKVGFGSLELRTSTIENDLRRFLLNRTVWCVSEFTKNDISSSAVLESQQVTLNLEIHDQGIDVKVNYPLKLYLAEEEFFHLSQFDFFYPTKFKTLLDTAVSSPLRLDWQYLDFNYSKLVLENLFFSYGNEFEVQNGNCLPFKNYFFCQQALFSEQYASLGIEMSLQPLTNGDDLFTFKSSSVLNSPELYTYQFVRQNRPPALDYLHRLECPAAGYDYLVIKDDPELGNINFDLSARDPDEDKFSYLVLSDDFGHAETQDYLRTNIPERKTPYSLYAYATDEHTAKDGQKVRVLVDRPVKLGISLSLPYQFRNSKGELQNYADIFPAGNTYLVSKEDPSFIKIQFPEKSYLSAEFYKQQPIILHYENKDKTEIFDLAPPAAAENSFCLSLPGMKSTDCSKFSLRGYEEYISKWNDLLKPDSDTSQADLSHFQIAPAEGILNLSISGNYCALFEKSESTAVKIVVNDCVPHRNPEYPWAFNPTGNYHQYKYGLNPDGTTNFNDFQGLDIEINPFEATHSCCIGEAESPNNWEVADLDYPKPCFVNPEPGCYGQVPSEKFPGTPYTSLQPGYVLEIQQQFCSGNRGNICDGDYKNKLKEGKLICGITGQNSCGSQINKNCQNILAFGFVGAEQALGWCHGTFGCSDFCQEEVAYTGPPTEQKSFDINDLALKAEALDEGDISFHCGCTEAEQICDSNFDGIFNGVCQADGSCTEA